MHLWWKKSLLKLFVNTNLSLIEQNKLQINNLEQKISEMTNSQKDLEEKNKKLSDELNNIKIKK